MHPITETYQFLSDARCALGIATKKEKFFTNEATDYEILYYIFEGKLPNHKNDPIMESAYLEQINKELGLSLVPLSEFKLTSQRNIMEHIVNNNLLSEGIIKPSVAGPSEKTMEIIRRWRERSKKMKKPGTTFASRYGGALQRLQKIAKVD